jgi:hypothetical protein
VQIDSDGFKTVSYKKEAAGASAVNNTVKHRRQPLIGVRNSPLLPIISKQARSRAFLFRVLAERFLLMMLKSS